MLDVSVSLLQFFELLPQCFEDLPHRRVIGQHHAADLVVSGYVGRLLGQSHLDAGRSPRNEVAQFALADSLQRFVHLSGVHLSLDYIQDRYVGALLDTHICQDVLRLKQASHHIQHSCFSD